MKRESNKVIKQFLNGNHKKATQITTTKKSVFLLQVTAATNMASTYKSRAAKQQLFFLGLPLDTYIFSCLSSSIQNTKDKTKLHKIVSAGYTEADEYGK